MNENHNHGKALEDAIERLVHGKKASGNELMDTLGATRPKANPAFMVNLEDRLMAELSSKEREIKMEKRKERPNKFGRWPLTMAAAVFAILLVGGFALFMQQDRDDSARGIVMNPVTAVVAVQALNPGTIIEEHMVEVRTFTPDPDLNQEALFSSEELVIGTMATENIAVGTPILASQIRFVQNPTDTPMAMIPVVIAIRDILEGAEITAEMVEVIHFPAANAPSGAFVDEEDVVGLTARTTIYQEEIILVRKVDLLEHCDASQAGTRIYEVRTGETLFSIAEANNVQVSELIALNCLEGVSGVHMGQLIRIPSEIDEFSLTATAIVATATASADTGETALIVLNAPEPLGCHNDNARILYPLNGQMIDRPVSIRAVASHDEFGQTRIEISGPSTNGQFVVIASIPQEALVETEIGQFVPSAYEDGEYQLRLNTFNTINSQVGTCTITIYLSSEAASTGEEQLRPVVIALRDIPMNTLITEDMVMLSYWTDAVAMQFAVENNGQWYLDNLEGVVGMMSTELIPAFQPISSNLLREDMACDAPCAVLPNNMVAIAVINNDDSAQYLLSGQSVDVIVSFNYRATSDSRFQVLSDGGELTMQRVVRDAQVVWAGSNAGDLWRGELPESLRENERLVVLAVSETEATTLQWIMEAELPILVVPAIADAEAVEIQQSSEIQIPENYQSVKIWMDASAMAFETGEHVDVFGTFTYMTAEGQIEGSITQRMAVDYIVLENVAGTGDMARFVEVTLAAPIGGAEFLNSDSNSSDYTVFESWTLLPHNPNYDDSPRYIPSLDASMVSRHFAVVPLEEVTSVSGGFSEGDKIRWNLGNGEVLEGTLAYFGAATHAPFIMQPGLDSYRMANSHVLIMEFSSAEEAAHLIAFVATGQSTTIEIVR